MLFSCYYRTKYKRDIVIQYPASLFTFSYYKNA